MAGGKRIANDEEYERSLNWLVSKSIELEDPLLDPAEREKLQRTYDYVAEAVQRYRRGQMVREFPGLREQYKALGWAYDEPEPERKQEASKSSEPPKTAYTAVEPKRKEPAAALVGWLNDD
jgi:hypothetical protein